MTAVAVPAIVAKAKPVDWVSVALAFSMPVIVALETFLHDHPSANMPPLSSALLIAALGSLLTQVDAIRRKRVAADEA